jgi:hypothetical protein
LGSEGGGLNYVRLAYEMPVWMAGMQAGVDSTAMNYRLGDSSASLLASGKATTGSVLPVQQTPQAALPARHGPSHAPRHWVAA